VKIRLATDNQGQLGGGIVTFTTYVTNLGLYEKGKPTTFIKPKLTHQEVYDLYLADK
jgi:hypothetical protein